MDDGTGIGPDLTPREPQPANRWIWVGVAAVVAVVLGVVALVFAAGRTAPQRWVMADGQSQQGWIQLVSLSGSTTSKPIRSDPFRVSSDAVALTYTVDRQSNAPCLFFVMIREKAGNPIAAPVIASGQRVDAMMLDLPKGEYSLEAMGAFCNWSVIVREAP